MTGWLGRLVALQRRQLRRAGVRWPGRLFGGPLLALAAALLVSAGLLASQVGGRGPHWSFPAFLALNALVIGWFGYVVWGYDRDDD